MIICAAIKFKILKTNKEVILCDMRHHDIFSNLYEMGLQPNEDYIEIEQGFIDHRHKFLSRQEAYIHAVECGQLSLSVRESLNTTPGTLFSEDLY